LFTTVNLARVGNKVKLCKYIKSIFLLPFPSLDNLTESLKHDHPVPVCPRLVAYLLQSAVVTTVRV